MLVETTSVPVEALPVSEFKDHLRLGSGFSDDGVQDTVLETYLRSAMAAIEARTGKVLLERGFSWTLTAWREVGAQALPVAPVSEITALTMIDRHGAESVIEPERYRLQMSIQRPKLVSTGALLPSIGTHGTVEIAFVAGYGPDWEDLPADLGQAVFLLGAHFYEHRAGFMSSDMAIPFEVSLLIDRYRTVRLFGEGAR